MRGLAVAFEHLTPRGVEIEQQFALRRIADVAARPADSRIARAAGDVRDVVQCVV